MGFLLHPLGTMSRTTRTSPTLKTGDSRRWRSTEVALEEAKAEIQTFPAQNYYDNNFDDGDYDYEEWSNWREWQLLTTTVFDDGRLRLEAELRPETDEHEACIHLNLETWVGNAYVGLNIVGFSSVRSLLTAFRAWIDKLKLEDTQYPLWFYPYTDDGKGNYRVAIYKKLGFTSHPDDTEGMLLYL